MGNPNSPLQPEDQEQPFVGRIVAQPQQATATQIHANGVNPYKPAKQEQSEPYEPLGAFGRHQLPILITIFVAAGILGLPLLFLSPAFSRKEKIFWTFMTLLYTVAIFWVFGIMLMMIWDSSGLQ
jgi:ABC-type multidrug transport system permease subunit